MNVQGGAEYAQVKDRLKRFREDCPFGKITTKPDIKEDGTIIFSATILKDKREASCAEATGHAMGNNEKQKGFEKLETIAVGRALAMLGYAGDGEIASGEEMEEFQAYQEEKRIAVINEAKMKLDSCKDMDELKTAWASLRSDLRDDKELLDLKNKLKKSYENN